LEIQANLTYSDDQSESTPMEELRFGRVNLKKYSRKLEVVFVKTPEKENETRMMSVKLSN
jgi:hypothetical protein